VVVKWVEGPSEKTGLLVGGALSMFDNLEVKVLYSS
jgi:hypothetical protein